MTSLGRIIAQLAVGAAAAVFASGAAHAANQSLLRISTLIGTHAHDRAGEGIGAVKDLVVDPASGRVQYIVLSKGGALGVGEKLYAVPFAHARIADGRMLTLDMSKADLEALPPPGGRDAKPTSAPPLRRASDMLKANVRDSHGGRVGKVHELLLDASAGRVQQVVVDVDRAWSPGDKVVVVPLTSFADGSTVHSFQAPVATGAAPPRTTSPPLALMNPSGEPTKGTASAPTPPGGVETRPPAVASGPGAQVQPLERQAMKTTTSYADDEALIYRGTREALLKAPTFSSKAG